MSKRPRPSDEPNSNVPKRRKVNTFPIRTNVFVEMSSRNENPVFNSGQFGFVEKGCDAMSVDDHRLLRASQCGYVDVVRLLLRRGAKVSDRICHPLRHASANGHAEVVETLLDAGANPFSILVKSPDEHINFIVNEHMKRRLDISHLPEYMSRRIIQTFKTNI